MLQAVQRRVRLMWTRCSHSAYDQHQKYSMRWPTPWSGFRYGKAWRFAGTTWTTSSWLGPLTPSFVRMPWEPWFSSQQKILYGTLVGTHPLRPMGHTLLRPWGHILLRPVPQPPFTFCVSRSWSVHEDCCL